MERAPATLLSPRGARVRLWYRPLAGTPWGRLLGPRFFHTWLELVAPDGRRPHGQPLSIGIYEKRPAEGGRAMLMHQGWEHEPEQLERFGSRHLACWLPGFDRADLALVRALCSGDWRDQGRYSFFSRWTRPCGRRDENCMTWLARFCRERGEPRALALIQRDFARGLRRA